MELKKIGFRVFLILFVLIFSTLAMGRAVDLYGWFSWWASDKNPIFSVGFITEIYEYRGRDSGKQRIHFSEKGGEGIILHSALEKKILKRVVDPRIELNLRSYPTPTGRRYVYFIGSSSGVIYEGVFRDSGWPGFLMFLIFVFHCVIILFFIKILLRQQGD